MSGLSDDDATLLELFEQRVQNGLVIPQTTSEESPEKTREPIKRVRLKKD